MTITLSWKISQSYTVSMKTVWRQEQTPYPVYSLQPNRRAFVILRMKTLVWEVQHFSNRGLFHMSMSTWHCEGEGEGLLREWRAGCMLRQ